MDDPTRSSPTHVDGAGRPLIRLGTLDRLPPADLRRAAAAGLTIEIPLPSVGFAQDPNDLAHDYARALYAAEALAPLGASPPTAEGKVARDGSARIHTVVRFRAKPVEADLDVFVARLVELSTTHSDLDEYHEHAYFSWGDVAELLDRVHDGRAYGTLAFPVLADTYMAYATYGAGDETALLPPDGSPEWGDGFWRSFEAASHGRTAYVSSDSWVVPAGEDLGSLLEAVGGFTGGAPPLLPSTTVQVGDTRLLVGSHGAGRRPSDSVEDRTRRVVDALQFAGSLPIVGFSPDVPSVSGDWATSSEGGVAVLTDRAAHRVFFPSSLDASDSATAFKALSAAVQTFGAVGGFSSDWPDLEWGRLDDEAFEQLCYDVLAASDQFHPDFVRKMGKSRSRDRGRDLIAYTRARPWEQPRRVVVQCKLVAPGKSLGARGLDIVDTVAEDGAAGYLVMTNGVVDATLHDRLRTIGEGNGWLTDAWGHMELEHRLHRRADIRERYFGPGGSG